MLFQAVGMIFIAKTPDKAGFPSCGDDIYSENSRQSWVPKLFHNNLSKFSALTKTLFEIDKFYDIWLQSYQSLWKELAQF